MSGSPSSEEDSSSEEASPFGEGSPSGDDAGEVDEESAGGVVVRRIEGRPHVLVILDPYGKWSLPKGHLEGDEGPEEAAVREVREETGLDDVTLGPVLDAVRWSFRREEEEVRKVCTYFLMSSESGEIRPEVTEGITECVWLPVDEALRRVDYDNTRHVIRKAERMLRDSPTKAEAEGDSPGAWRIAQGVTALLVLGLFLFSLRDILTPFLLFWVLVVVLLPFRGSPGHVLLISLAAVLTGLWVLETTGFLLAPFVLALVLAYILDPLVDRIQAWNLSRTLAISTLVLPLGLALGALVFWGIPALGEQIGSLAREVPDMLSRLVGWAESLRGRILRWDLPLVDEETLLARLRSVQPADVVGFLEARMAEVGQQVWGGILGLGRGIGSVVTIAGYVILTPVLTFFLLRDWDELVEKVVDLLPRTHKESIVTLGREYDDLLSRYLRGQITVALTVGLITTAGLWIAQFPYALLLGAIVAVFSVVPYLGLALSLIPAVGIALLSGQVLLSLLKVAVVYGVAQGLEGAVISPRIVGESVGLHPVWIVLALAVGGFYFGFVGLLIAVPVAVGLKLLILRGLERYRQSKLYNGEPAEAS